MTHTQPLNDKQIVHKSFNVVPKSIDFSNNMFFADQLFTGFE